MELDEMKNLWEKTTQIVEKTKINEEKIMKMLKNSYKGAMNSLLNFELLGLVSMLPCAGIFYFMFGMRFNHVAVFDIIKWIFIILCIIGFFWQWYKYQFLKKVNLTSMNLVEVTRKMLTYRKYIVNECKFGIIFLATVMPVLMYFIHSYCFGNKVIISILVLYIVIYILQIVATLFLYRQLYFKNIKKIQETLEEIEDFEQEPKVS